MRCSCTRPRSPSIPRPPGEHHVTERDINGAEESSLSCLYSLGLLICLSLWPFCSPQGTSTGNGVTKRGTSSWGDPFSLGPLQLPLAPQQAGKCSRRAAFQRGHRTFDHCGPLCRFWQKRGTEQPAEQLQKRPRSGPNPETQNEGSNFKSGPELRKMWCDGWVERLGNPC